MDIKRVPIDSVACWDKNPRNIKTKDFDRLKRQIQRLGVYKPLIACKEGDGYIVLGGNMRLLALQALGIEQVEISIVDASTDGSKIEYALSDNDRAGEYDEQRLAELVYPHIEEINLEDYRVDLGEAVDLQYMIDKFSPVGEDEQSRLDQLAEKETVKCPECGHEFIP